MKKLFLLLVALFSFTGIGFAQQAQKPKIMVMPDREWCISHGYLNDAKEPDFYKALQDPEFQSCVTQFSGIMAERNYPLKDLSQTLESFRNGKAKRAVMTGKDGSMVYETDEDALARAAALDIKIRFNIKKMSYGGRNQVEFQVKAVDAGTDEIIWAEPFPPIVTAAPASTVLSNAVASKMDSFCQGLQQYFDNMMAQGRKCIIELNISDTCPLNMNSDIEYQGEEGELSDFINMWMVQNAVDGNVSDLAKEDHLYSAEVYIPLFGKGMGGTLTPINAESWIKKMNSALKSNFNIQMKTSPFGQGRVYGIISGL